MRKTAHSVARVLLLSAIVPALGIALYFAAERVTTSMKNTAFALEASALKPLIDSNVPKDLETATFAMG